MKKNIVMLVVLITIFNVGLLYAQDFKIINPSIVKRNSYSSIWKQCQKDKTKKILIIKNELTDDYKSVVDFGIYGDFGENAVTCDITLDKINRNSFKVGITEIAFLEQTKTISQCYGTYCAFIKVKDESWEYCDKYQTTFWFRYTPFDK